MTLEKFLQTPSGFKITGHPFVGQGFRTLIPRPPKREWAFGICPRNQQRFGLEETRLYKRAYLGRFTITLWKDTNLLAVG